MQFNNTWYQAVRRVILNIRTNPFISNWALLFNGDNFKLVGPMLCENLKADNDN